MEQPTCPDCGRVPHKWIRTVCSACYDRRWRSGTLDEIPKRARPDLSARTEKPCAICRMIKPLGAFARNNRRPDGRGSYCKECARERYHRPIRERNRQVQPYIDGEITCRTCGVGKPVTEFYWRSDVARYRSECIDCRAAAEKAWREQNPDLHRDKVLRGKYGIGLEQFTAMLAAQGGGCAICGVAIHDDGRALAVDHCHTTGRVRGVLCGNCNMAIGLLRDDPALAERAAEYLRAR